MVEDLVERSAVLARIKRPVAEGAGGCAVLGDPGLGKTSVWRRVLAEVPAESRVFAARGSELERDHPFGVVRQLFARPLARATAPLRAQLLDGVASLAGHILDNDDLEDGTVTDFAAMHSLYWLCVRFSDETPLVIAVDDVHWADPESQRFLAFLGGRLEGEHIALVVTARPQEIAPASPLRDLLDSDGIDVVELEPLSYSGVSEMFTLRGRDAGTATVEALHAATTGNPLLITLALPSLETAGIAPTTTDAVVAVARVDVAAEVAHRLARAGEAATSLAIALATLGGEQPLGLVARLAGLSLRDAGHAAHALRAADVIIGDDTIRFAHALLAGAVAAAIPPGSHRHAAELLATSGHAEEIVAAQLMCEVPAGDEWTTERLVSAASNALRRGAADVATRLLSRALAEPPDTPRRAEILHALGVAESWVGNADAVQHLRAALAESDRALRPAVARDLARAHAVRLEHEDAVAVLEKALEELSEDDRTTAAMFERMLVINGLQDSSLVSQVLPWVGRLAEHGGDPVAREIVGLMEAMSAGFLGGTAQDILAAIRRNPPSEDSREVEWDVRSLTVYSLAMVDESDSWTERLLAHADDFAARTGSARAALLSFSGRIALAEERGDVADTVTHCRLMLELARELGLRSLCITGASVLALALLEAGATDEAEALIVSVDGAIENNIRVVAYYDAVARIALERGRPDDALRAMDAAEAHLGRLLPMTVSSPSLWSWRAPRVLALRSLGRVDEAADVAQAELEAARRFGAARPLGIAVRGAAAAAATDGERIDLLQEGVAALGGSRARLEYGYVLHDLGAAWRRAGKRAEARRTLTEALDVAVVQGSVRLADRAREELAACGARVRRDRTTGPASLTPTEARVARLAREGKTNRDVAQALYVTTKTVETHLASVYRKLSISGRGELVTALGAPDTNQ